MTPPRPEAVTGLALDAASLPRSLREIAQVIGLPAALQLSATYPGQRIHVPKHLPAEHGLALAIGRPAAQALCEVYGGADLVVPMAHAARRRALHQAIIAALEAGGSAAEVARRFGVHQYTVYRLSSRRAGGDQGSLF